MDGTFTVLGGIAANDLGIDGQRTLKRIITLPKMVGMFDIRWKTKLGGGGYEFGDEGVWVKDKGNLNPFHGDGACRLAFSTLVEVRTMRKPQFPPADRACPARRNNCPRCRRANVEARQKHVMSLVTRYVLFLKLLLLRLEPFRGDTPSLALILVETYNSLENSDSYCLLRLCY